MRQKSAGQELEKKKKKIACEVCFHGNKPSSEEVATWGKGVPTVMGYTQREKKGSLIGKRHRDLSVLKSDESKKSTRK